MNAESTFSRNQQRCASHDGTLVLVSKSILVRKGPWNHAYKAGTHVKPPGASFYMRFECTSFLLTLRTGSKTSNVHQHLFLTYHRCTLGLCIAYFEQRTCSAHRPVTHERCDQETELTVYRSNIKERQQFHCRNLLFHGGDEWITLGTVGAEQRRRSAGISISFERSWRAFQQTGHNGAMAWLTHYTPPSGEK